MGNTLIAKYAALESLLAEIADESTDALTESEIAEIAITHERLTRTMGSTGLRRIADVSDREAYRTVQCRNLIEFVGERLRVATPRKRLREVAELSSMLSMTGEPLPPRCPETAAAMADGDLSHEHVIAVLDVLDKVPAATPSVMREGAEAQLADIARDFGPREIARAGARILAHLDPDGDLPSDRDRARNRGVGIGTQDSLLMSKLTGHLDPMTRALFDVVLAAWAAPGMNNPDDEHSPHGGNDDDGIDPALLREAADRDHRSQSQRNHDALKALLQAAVDGGLLGSSHRGLPPHIIVSITDTQLRQHAGIAHTATGADLPMTDVVAMAATAQMHLSVFEDATGEPLFYGRAKRLATQAQRFVLFSQYGGCGKAGCPAPFAHAEIHHAENDWADGGVTDVTDLAPACGPHNRAVGDGPGQFTTVKIDSGPDRGRYGWVPNGSTGPPRANHLHRPAQIVADHVPPDPVSEAVQRRLQFLITESIRLPRVHRQAALAE
ncbi:HNH endonuclease signature motif containing protein [Williamsia herbipolensis]|uniref:HNH endonuclease signature motif containing protein n=1 Tax=Williamsia herbipolensis TaxID=1603258 RepID=UPI000695C344|nr:HNH endonuclease signature motif containing protein [Williamsia herbipolensis]